MLRGKIACLTHFSETDSELLFSWINDRELVLFNAPFRPVHQDSHREWFGAIQKRSDLVIFGIRRLADDSLVGSCQLHLINPIHRSAELQIRIGRKDAQGNGIGTEACALLLRHAFDDLNLNRVYLQVFETNERAIGLYKRAGFKVEGTLRQSAFIDGRWVNVLVMAILREEYPVK